MTVRTPFASKRSRLGSVGLRDAALCEAAEAPDGDSERRMSQGDPSGVMVSAVDPTRDQRRPAACSVQNFPARVTCIRSPP